jgi:hypothetical protein
MFAGQKPFEPPVESSLTPHVRLFGSPLRTDLQLPLS